MDTNFPTQQHNPNNYEHRETSVRVMNEAFNSQLVPIRPSQATGEGLIHALGYKPAEEYIVLRYRNDGSLHEIGLQEPFALNEPLENAFFVNKSDDMYNVFIEGARVSWTQFLLTGTALKKLGRVNEDLQVYLERRDAAPVPIGDEDHIDLRDDGVERIHFGPPLQVEITVNMKSVTISRGRRSGLEIKQAAISAGLSIQLSFTLSQDGPDHSQIVGDDDHVRIKGGECFLAIDDHDDS